MVLLRSSKLWYLPKKRCQVFISCSISYRAVIKLSQLCMFLFGFCSEYTGSQHGRKLNHYTVLYCFWFAWLLSFCRSLWGDWFLWLWMVQIHTAQPVTLISKLLNTHCMVQKNPKDVYIPLLNHGFWEVLNMNGGKGLNPSRPRGHLGRQILRSYGCTMAFGNLARLHRKNICGCAQVGYRGDKNKACCFQSMCIEVVYIYIYICECACVCLCEKPWIKGYQHELAGGFGSYLQARANEDLGS